jgi:hypothetical protein
MMDRYNCNWPLWFAPAGAVKWAVTINQTTYYSGSENEVDAAWRRHEDKHKEQWRREGLIKFAVKYLWYHIRYGYQGNPFEVEARGD